MRQRRAIQHSIATTSVQVRLAVSYALCYTLASVRAIGVGNDYGQPRALIAIVGPTAVGKTAVAIELVRRIGGEIISADSIAVYKGMNIGAAKPTEQQRRQARIHLIDIVKPDEPFTVADYQKRAVAVIDGLIAKARTPVLVGGTGLYIKAVIDGLDIPPARPDTEFRNRMAELATCRGREHVYDLLKQVDPETALRLHPNDLKRVIRALEVYEQTGALMSQQHRLSRKSMSRYPDAAQFGLTMDRQALYQLIDERVEAQIRAGLVDEVAGLLSKGYGLSLPAMQGLGYKELTPHIRGSCSLGEATEAIKRSTRRFAKRQLTWFRADKRIRWIDSTDMAPSEVADRITQFLRNAGQAQ